jgi:dTDP-4-dehydrorhamnose 3,5-epimerase
VDGINLSPLKKINHSKGDILHAIKSSENEFEGFGEAYFSFVKKHEIKGWKKHTKMVSNLVVPIGEIQFVIFSEKNNKFFNVCLSQNNYQRLTIRPGLWLAFKGISNKNMLLNISNIEHDPDETVNTDLENIPYDW